jgi:hypothetical protein
MSGKRNPPLTPEFILSRLTVDVEKGKAYWIDATNYHRHLVGKEAGCLRHSRGGKYYWYIRINGCLYKRSHIVFTIKAGKWPLEQVDHIDGDSTSDRGDNLRECNQTQNMQNMKRRKKASNLPMGVRQRPNGNYQAYIKIENAMAGLGTFTTLQPAQDAYLAARKKHFGEFA